MNVAMKRSHRLLLVTHFLLPLVGASQSTLFLSNIGEPPAGSVAVGRDQWVATRFNTGTNSMGYVLSRVDLSMSPASGNPGNFSVYLYDINAARQPGQNLVALAGSDPAAGGIFAFSTPGITLSAFGAYFVVVTSASGLADGSYQWNRAASSGYEAVEQWSSFGNSYASSDGSAWTRQDNPYQFAVYATAVPEPIASALVAWGLLGLGCWRCKGRLAKPTA